MRGGSTLRLDRQSGDLAVEHPSGALVTLTTSGCTDTVVTNNVVASSSTPGAGNVW